MSTENSSDGQTKVVEPAPEVEQKAPEADRVEDDPAGAERRLRKRAQQAEVERDTLAGRVEALQRAEVDRLVAAEQVEVRGFWASGVELGALLDDAGAVDPKKVTVEIKAAVVALGLAQKVPVGVIIPGLGYTPSHSTRTSWSEAINGR